MKIVGQVNSCLPILSQHPMLDYLPARFSESSFDLTLDAHLDVLKER